MAEKEYRYVGDYARDIEGVTLAPGDYVKIDRSKAEDLTKELLDSNVLISASPPDDAGKSASGGNATHSESSKGGSG